MLLLICSIPILYLVISQYIVSRLSLICKQMIARNGNIIYRLRQYLPNLNQWELHLLLKRGYWWISLFVAFYPILSVIFFFCRLFRLNFPIDIPQKVTRYFQNWMLEVAHRQQIFKTKFSTIDHLKKIGLNNLSNNVYLILTCGHILTWRTIDHEGLTTNQIRQIAYQKLFVNNEVCGNCSKEIDNFIVIKKEKLERIVTLLKQYDLNECCMTGKVFTRDSVIGLLPCGHYSDFGGLTRWYKENKRCPYCNLSIEQLYFHRISDTTVNGAQITSNSIGNLLWTIINENFTQEQIDNFKNVCNRVIPVVNNWLSNSEQDSS